MVRGCETPIFSSWPLVACSRRWTVTRSEFGRGWSARFVCGLSAREPASPAARGADARVARFTTRRMKRERHLDFFQHGTLLHARVPTRGACPNCGGAQGERTPWARGEFRVHVVVRGLRAGAGQGDADRQCGRSGLASTTRACGGSSSITFGARWRRWICRSVRRIAADETSARRGHDAMQPVRRHGAAQSHLRGRRQGRGDGRRNWRAISSRRTAASARR